MKFKVETAVAVAFAAVCLSGCASIVAGTSQEIKVVTNPAGVTFLIVWLFESAT